MDRAARAREQRMDMDFQQAKTSEDQSAIAYNALQNFGEDTGHRKVSKWLQRQQEAGGALPNNFTM